jgi:hypothetical protein
MKATLGKVMYMSLGALIALVGYIVGTMNNNIHAQSEVEPLAVDEIVVQTLRVVDANGNTVVKLGSLISGGMVSVTTTKGLEGPIVVLTALEEGALAVVKGQKGGVRLGSNDRDGPQVNLFNQGLTPQLDLHLTSQGGRVSVWDKNGQRGAFLNHQDTGNSIR